MEKESFVIANQNQCLGCLSEIDTNTLNLYSFKLNVLIELTQINEAFLCSTCYKQANDAENFIQNVLDNHKLLQDFLTNVNPNVEKTESLKSEYEENELKKEIESDEKYFKDDFSNHEYNTHIKEEAPEPQADDSECDELITGIEIIDDIGEITDSPSQLVKYPDEEVSDEGAVKKSKSEERVKKSKSEESVKKSKSEESVKKEKGDGSKPRNRKSYYKIRTLMLNLEECMEERAEWARQQPYIDSPFKCTDCIKVFSYQVNLDEHIKKSHSKGDHECFICKVRFPTAERLSIHKTNTHMRSYKCMLCDYVRKDRGSVVEHYETQHLNKKFKCLICNKEYTNRNGLKRHTYRSHSADPDSIKRQCPHCVKTFVSRQGLIYHMQKVHYNTLRVQKPRLYACEQCGKSFNQSGNLKAHMRSHSGVKPFYCVECDKSFTTEYSLRSHLTTVAPHANKEDLQFQCDYCKKRFVDKTNLSRHILVMHMNYEKFKCDKCDKAYTHKGSLMKHKKYKHSSYERQRRFGCHICDKKFMSKVTLQNHIRTHTGERPFQCKKCSDTFANKSTLFNHDNLVHLKKKRNRKTNAKKK